jgi:hypothetical protein
VLYRRAEDTTLRRLAIAIAAVLALGLLPSRAECQGAWWVTPYLSLSGEYDSNVFSTPTGESSDLIGTVSFGLSLAYQSPTLALSASYGTSAEWYRDETQLDNFGDNQNAGFGLNWQIDPRTSVGLSLSYSRTNDSADFLSPAVIGPPPRLGAPDPSAPATVPAPTVPGPVAPTAPTGLPDATVAGVPGVGVGRRLSEVFGAGASINYQLNPLTTGTAGYNYTRTHVEGDPESERHGVTLGLGYALTRVDGLSLSYQFEYFTGEAQDSETGHTVLLGWSRQLGPSTSMVLQAGPHISGQGDVDLSANAGLSHQFGWGTVRLGYSRSQSLVVGRTGAQTVDMFTAGLGARPQRDVGLALVGSASRIEEDGPAGDTWTYAITATGTYAITNWLAARLSYEYSYEDSAQAIQRHVVILSLDLSYPFRLDR